MYKYAPVLRDSSAEMKALSEFYVQFPNDVEMLPIIECPNIPITFGNDRGDFPQKLNTLGSYLKTKVDEHAFIFSLVPAFSNISSPADYRSTSGKSLTQFVNDKLVENKLNFSLMISYDSPDWLLDEINDLNLTNLWISFSAYDFKSTIDDAIITSMLQRLKSRLHNINLNLQVNFYNKLEDPDRIFNFIHRLFQETTNVIFTATSCLPNSANIPHSSITLLSDRTDFHIYKKMQQSFKELIYSDYTVRLMPEPSEEAKHDINLDNTYFKIFYTTEDSYYILKSGQVSKARDAANPSHKTIQEICNKMIHADIYDGSSFSWGDSRISEVAMGAAHIRDHRTPIGIGINHHLVKTLHQL
ncbi:beta family protein [Levilactobacillus brevis]|uniref:beta family protein n=1 Tax=Levilactobacillus brevis TaxID=1580 RepID=UPI001C129579|nr:beta family protein [Levilactobacillus brevis]MBU5274348.1 beta family protein [Levilactobacillus brevis]